MLAAIVAVTGEAGCLLVILNYTGDRLNFGMAAQRARNEYNLNVKTVRLAYDGDQTRLSFCEQILVCD